MNVHVVPGARNSKRLLVVELNEFDPTYLADAAAKLRLTHLERVLSFNHANTSTVDEIEHQGLDPWVQWVGIHCGKPTTLHGIRRLGATRQQTSAQIWHAVADQGGSWGVWGVMNAPMGNPVGCKFFMPDPWSFEEVAYPRYLNDLLALPRYAARNYLELNYKQAFFSVLRLARFFAPPSHWATLARFGMHASASVMSTGPNIHTFTTLLDYLSVLCFIDLRRKHLPNLSLIFLNHIAHLQHQFWSDGPEPTGEMKLGLQLSNAMLGLLLADRQLDEGFVLMNGLRQKNVAGEGFRVYRQRNPQQAIEAMGVQGGRVEQCMTHDATILFAESKDADRASELLDCSALSDGHKAFYVERQDANRVFYQLAFEHEVHPDTMIVCGNYARPFFDVFQLVCERTGAHVPTGDIFFDGINIADKIQNHEVFGFLLDYYRKDESISSSMNYGAMR